MLAAVTLTLSVLEIVLLLFGAIVLGITIHFFIASNKSLRAAKKELERTNPVQDEWKLRYFNDIEARDSEISSLRQQLTEAEENARIYSSEAQEIHKQKRALEAEMIQLQKTIANVTVEKEQRPAGDYLVELRQAQSSLLEHQQQINQLISNIESLKEKEEMQREILRSNEELSEMVNTLRQQLAEKEKEINHIRQKEQITSEMKSMLDSTYHEFSTLQAKIQKLEAQLTASKMLNLEFEDLRETHSRISHELDESRHKTNSLVIENKNLQAQLLELEEKLRDANFHRQQLQKRISYLEDLNRDLQVVSDTNKKLESQLKRMGELESMLNIVSEERDQLRNRGEM